MFHLLMNKKKKFMTCFMENLFLIKTLHIKFNKEIFPGVSISNLL